MKSLTPKGHTRTLAVSQDEYNNLAIKDVEVELSTGVKVNCMFSCWVPDEAELKQLYEGGHVSLGILGTNFPPVIITTAAKECGINGKKVKKGVDKG